MVAVKLGMIVAIRLRMIVTVRLGMIVSCQVGDDSCHGGALTVSCQKRWSLVTVLCDTKKVCGQVGG